MGGSLSTDSYEAKKRRLVQQMQAAASGPLGLQKDTSNLFRDRVAIAKQRLDVREFDTVLQVDPRAGWLDVEGMTPYQLAVDAALAQGLMPAVVPELKSITVGGAAAGVGIESASFRYGLMHETVLEMDVLLADGRILTCSPDNAHRALFFGFPNSYGTLGYALRLRVKAVPVQPYVELAHRRFADPGRFFAAIEEASTGSIDFLDGTVFAPDALYLTTGRFVSAAPWTSDYTFRRMYYRSIRERERDFLSVHDYIWRWDTDWFWCSKNVGAQNPLIRRLLGRKRLNSITYTRIMRWNSRHGLSRRIDGLLGRQAEGVIQDVDIPLARAAEFLAFLHAEVGIRPIWICPIRPADQSRHYPLYPLAADTLYINFGFWDTVRVPRGSPPGLVNRKTEAKTIELGGIKSLYSSAYFVPETFWRIYDGEAYAALKAQYDPEYRLGDLYRKCVLRE